MIKIITISTFIALLAPAGFALTPLKDTFSKTSLDSSRWESERGGRGKFGLSRGRLQYTASRPTTDDDYALIALRNNRPRYNESWQVIVDAVNKVGKGDEAGVGIFIANAADLDDNVILEFYGSASNGGFNFIQTTNGKDDPSQDIRVNPLVQQGSMRISFSQKTKRFTFWYDSTGPADGYQWTRLCTFSPTGKGGDRRANWRMRSTSGRFVVGLTGYSIGPVVGRGRATLDNFVLKAAK